MTSKPNELPSPCPICGKRHKTGSGPYNAHLTEYCKRLMDDLAEHPENYTLLPTKTEEFFTRENPDKKLDTPSPNAPSIEAGASPGNAEDGSKAGPPGDGALPGNGKEASAGIVTVEVPVKVIEHVKKGGTVTGELVKLDTPDDIITTIVDDDGIPEELIPEGSWKTVGKYPDGETHELVIESGETEEWIAAMKEMDGEVVDKVIADTIKPPSGAKHLTVSPGNDIKTTGIFMEAVIDKNGIISKRRLTDDEIKTLEKFKDEPLVTMFEVLCKKGEWCPKCDIQDCETRVKPYKPKKKKWYQFWKRDRGE